MRGTTAQYIVSRSGYIWIWSGARDQETTNHSAHFVEWKSGYITIIDINLKLHCINDCYGNKQLNGST